MWLHTLCRINHDFFWTISFQFLTFHYHSEIHSLLQSVLHVFLPPIILNQTPFTRKHVVIYLYNNVAFLSIVLQDSNQIYFYSKFFEAWSPSRHEYPLTLNKQIIVPPTTDTQFNYISKHENIEKPENSPAGRGKNLSRVRAEV